MAFAFCGFCFLLPFNTAFYLKTSTATNNGSLFLEIKAYVLTFNFFPCWYLTPDSNMQCNTNDSMYYGPLLPLKF